jgi:hypothetical protein
MAQIPVASILATSLFGSNRAMAPRNLPLMLIAERVNVLDANSSSTRGMKRRHLLPDKAT